MTVSRMTLGKIILSRMTLSEWRTVNDTEWMTLSEWHSVNDIQENDAKQNDIQENDAQQNDIQENGAQQNDIQQNDTQGMTVYRMMEGWFVVLCS